MEILSDGMDKLKMCGNGTSESDGRYRIDIESLEAFTDLWRGSRDALQWTCPFVLPPWLSAWRSVFGRDAQPLVAAARRGSALVGVAPLMRCNNGVRFLGDPELFDYFDCVTAPGEEEPFFTALFSYFAEQGFKEIELGPLRPSSPLARFLSRGALPGMRCEPASGGVLFEMRIPGSREEFLALLDGKERHELRRKLRKLRRAGAARFRRVEDPAELPEAMEVFLRLFSMNRADKAAFMTERMASFFRSLASALAAEGMLRLFFLDLDGEPAASVFCFDYMGVRYLYNNGYDEARSDLSVGLISKALSIELAIEDGLRSYNFLKGDEPYKRRLGGVETPLTKYRATKS